MSESMGGVVRPTETVEPVAPHDDWPQTSSVLQDLPVAYTEVDASGALRIVNEAACRLFGMTAEEMIGHSVWEFVPPNEAARDRAEYLHAMESGEDLRVIRRLMYSFDGEYRTHELHRRMLRDTHGRPVGVSCASFDVSEREAAHHETRQAMLWLESVVHAIPQALVVIDALGSVRLVNPAAERLTGWKTEELIGQQIEKALPILHSTSEAQGPLNYRSVLSETWNGDVAILDRSNRSLSVWLSASPVVDAESGSTNGVAIVLRALRSAEEVHAEADED